MLYWGTVKFGGAVLEERGKLGCQMSLLPGNSCKEAVLSPQLVEGTAFNYYFNS